FKTTGFVALFASAIVIALLIAIPILLLLGAAELSARALGWMPVLFAAIAGVGGALAGFLALGQTKRGRAAAVMLFASVLLAALLWVWSLAFTYSQWGLLPVVIGLLVFGFGIVPVAFIVAVFEAQWATLGLFTALIGCIYAYRVAGTNLLREATGRAFDKMRGAPPEQPLDDGTTIEGNYTERQP
ncbi:MAG: hypothetical protein WBA68_09380, partial [Alteraurantiacibacter sp.]